MRCGRIAFAVAFMSALCPLTASADDPCGPDTIFVRASADTVFVKHENALANCCLELQVSMQSEAETIDFYEIDGGDPCHCMCCFDLDFNAGGFSAGHYVVRIWDATGAIIFGQAEVDVPGGGAEPAVLSTAQGECRNPQATGVVTWGKVRSLYR